MPDYPSGLALGLRIQGYRVRFPARAGHFLVMLGYFQVTFWSCWGHFFDDFGASWDVFGSTLGTFSDGFGMVLRGGRKC